MLFLQDYGITERGGKTNLGQPELNTSSIGMAKVGTLWEFLMDCFFMLPQTVLYPVHAYGVLLLFHLIMEHYQRERVKLIDRTDRSYPAIQN